MLRRELATYGNTKKHKSMDAVRGRYKKTRGPVTVMDVHKMPDQGQRLSSAEKSLGISDHFLGVTKPRSAERYNRIRVSNYTTINITNIKELSTRNISFEKIPKGQERLKFYSKR